MKNGEEKTFGLILTLVLILLGTIAVGAGLKTADSALLPVVKLGVYTILVCMLSATSESLTVTPLNM